VLRRPFGPGTEIDDAWVGEIILICTAKDTTQRCELRYISRCER
jgi:hypothetical protein